MKIRNILYSLLVLTIATSTLSCSDFLSTPPNDRNTLDNFFTSPEDLKTATAPLYNIVWFKFNEKFYYGLGDGRSDNLFAPYSDYIYPFTTLTESSLTGPLVDAWGALYKVVGQSNNVINNIQTHASGVTEEQKQAAIGEARFMRGVAYWYLASLWENVIIIEDNTKLISNPIVNTNPRIDVMEFAIRDLEYAAKYLPDAASEPGRLTKYSAFGMLSRVYLSRAGLTGDNRNSGTRDVTYLDLAKKAAAKVCKEGPYHLMPHYADLYYVKNNNNSESMFALEWMPKVSDWATSNPQQAFFAASSLVTGDDAAWGGYTFASYDVIRFYDPKDVARRKATFMARGDYYPELNAANGGYTQDNTDQCYVKKGVVGTPKDNEGKSARANSALNTYMLRLAEVYLNYTEAILGNNASTSDPDALYYFNMVRTRAKMPPLTSITWKDLFYERRVELAMEGQFWYDLVRRSYYKQQEVLNFMDGQDRSAQYKYDDTNNILTSDTKDSRPVESATIDRLKLPYPESEVVQNPLLKEAPVPYTFTESKITDLYN